LDVDVGLGGHGAAPHGSPHQSTGDGEVPAWQECANESVQRRLRQFGLLGIALREFEMRSPDRRIIGTLGRFAAFAFAALEIFSVVAGWHWTAPALQAAAFQLLSVDAVLGAMRRQ